MSINSSEPNFNHGKRVSGQLYICSVPIVYSAFDEENMVLDLLVRLEEGGGDDIRDEIMRIVRSLCLALRHAKPERR
jgi:hypothetical protein